MSEVQPDAEAVDKNLVGIGGWLIFPAMALILAPILSVVGLIVSAVLMSEVSRAGHGGVHALNMAVELGMLLFLIYAATRFFGKRSDAPSIMIALYSVRLIAGSILLMVELGAGAEPYAVESEKALFKGAIGAAIWIPYFRVSKRVKATFVESGQHSERDQLKSNQRQIMAPATPEKKRDEKELCYLCGKLLQPSELAVRVCQACCM